MAYATVEQYVARFGAVPDDGVLKECLDDASAAIDAALDMAGIDHASPSEDFADRLMRVCRSVANRIMPACGDMPQGATSVSRGAVGFSETYQFSKPYGVPKLIKSELSMLGIGGKIGVAVPSYGRLEAQDD